MSIRRSRRTKAPPAPSRSRLRLPARSNPIARLEIMAPIPKFVPELFEIDADGSAILIGGATQILAHFSHGRSPSSKR